MAKPQMAQSLTEIGTRQKRLSLTAEWDCWASPQLAAACAAPVEPPVQQKQVPSRASVIGVLEQQALLEPLVQALSRADAAMQACYAPADRDKARAILLSIVASEIDKLDKDAGEAGVVAATQASVVATQASVVATQASVVAAQASVELPVVEVEPPVSEARVQALADRVSRALYAGDLDAADAGTAELLALLPTNADVRITAAHLAMRRGKLRTAQDQLLRASLLVASGEPTGKRAVGSGFLQLARGWQASGDATMCKLNLERGLRIDPDNADAKALLASLEPLVAPAVADQAPVAPAVANQDQPMVSIVVLCCNGLADTERCLASIAQHCSVPYELIVVDNASGDGTAEFVREWCGAHAQARCIRNRENLGYAGGNNAGIAAARADHVVVLNNDTIVTSGWLEGMLDVFAQHPKTGVVGPRSNYTDTPQIVKSESYDSVAELPAFAANWARSHQGKSNAATCVSGFCLMASRKVIEHIGGFDTRFGVGNFEDQDFCFRARIAGFECRVAHEVFIHHEGHKSFTANGIDHRAQTAKNWEILKAKWGIDPRHELQAGFPAKIRPPLDALRRLPLPEIGASYRSEMDGRRLDEVAQDPTPANHVDRADLGTTVERGALFDQGEQAASQGDWQRASELFEHIRKGWPDFAPAHVGVASAAFALGDIPRGSEALDRACELEPGNTPLQVQRAAAMASAGLLDRARTCFAQVLERAPDNIDAMLGMAHVCRRQRKYIDAVDVLDRANARYPDDANIIAAIGGLAAELGDKQAAQQALATLQRTSPNHPQTTSLRQELGSTAG